MSAHAPLAILAPAYPVLSETFVRRDVQGLRALGLEVRAIGLREGEPEIPGAGADYVVYRGGSWWTATVREILRHPLQSVATLMGALRDALTPAEPTSTSSRAKILVQAFAGVGLGGWLRASGVTHIHCHFAHAPATVGMYAAQQAAVPFSFVGHANDLFQRRQLLRRKLQRAKFTACISRWHRDFYADVEPACGDRLRIVRCGVDIDAWDAPPPVRRSGSHLRVVTVARLVEKKGIDTLISALARLGAEKDPDVRLVVIGDGPLAAELHAQGEREGVGDRVDWQGAQAGGHVRALMEESDVFVLPCRVSGRGDMDGIPVALMEAMACRTPVVAGDLPAIRELVEDGVTGLLVQGADVEGLCHALRRLAAEPEFRAELGRQGRARVVDEFSAQVNVDRLTRAIGEPASWPQGDADARAPAPEASS